MHTTKVGTLSVNYNSDWSGPVRLHDETASVDHWVDGAMFLELAKKITEQEMDIQKQDLTPKDRLERNSNGPRELTEDEVQGTFLRHVRAMCRYWVEETRATTTKEKVEGVAFSILVALDGGNIGLPSFIVAPSPHPDDREYHRSRGENWYPENNPEAIKCDIGGSLHERFHIHEPPSTNAASDTIPAGSPWENT